MLVVELLLPGTCRSLLSGLLLLVSSALAPVWAFDHGHQDWDRLLTRHVVWVSDGTASRVDYAGFQADARDLETYLESLSAVTAAEFTGWSRDQRLAFLINAYNAFTLQLVLKRYPDLQSIKDLGSLFSSPWNKRFFTLLGAQRSLDDIEHRMIRSPGAYDEPRIHFAVNCASIGCPALPDEAFVADRLERQLQNGVRRFLSDRSRNRYNTSADVLEVSKIFHWYGEDFEPQFGSVRGFLAPYDRLLADSDSARSRIRHQETKLRFLAYDWNLNSLSQDSKASQ